LVGNISALQICYVIVIITVIFTTYSELHEALFLALSVTFLFVYEISPEPLNGFVPNSQGRRVWSLAQTSLKISVKGQGHHAQKTLFLADISLR